MRSVVAKPKSVTDSCKINLIVKVSRDLHYLENTEIAKFKNQSISNFVCSDFTRAAGNSRQVLGLEAGHNGEFRLCTALPIS